MALLGALWITEETVRTHVRRVLGKLNARTRAHAVSIAYRDGLFGRGVRGGEPV
jgi:DNA-binding CsgD family transcriptional regulator